MTWTAPRTWVASEFVTASIGNTHWRDNLLALSDRIQPVRKSANEDITSSTTLQNDNELLFTAVAGQNYIFFQTLTLTCASGTPDFKMGYTNPGGSLSWGVIGSDLAATTGTSSVVLSGRTIATSSTAVSTGTVNGTLHHFTAGSFECTTGGAVQLQWAQDTSSVNTVTINEGSSLIAFRVST